MIAKTILLVNKIFDKQSTILVAEASEWLTQSIKSDVRKNKPYFCTIKQLTANINKEFTCELTAKQLIKIINETRLKLKFVNIELFADSNNIIANRPINLSMLQT